MANNVTTLPARSTPKTAAQFEMLGAVEFRLLVLTCCSTLEDYSDRFGVPIRTVSRWVSGETAVPHARVLQLRAYARELGVVANDNNREAA